MWALHFFFTPRHTSHMALTCARTFHGRCGITIPLGHIQKIPVRTQIEAGYLGQITSWPEETAQKKSREAFVQVWDQRKWGEALLYFWNEIWQELAFLSHFKFSSRFLGRLLRIWVVCDLILLEHYLLYMDCSFDFDMWALRSKMQADEHEFERWHLSGLNDPKSYMRHQIEVQFCHFELT